MFIQPATGARRPRPPAARAVPGRLPNGDAGRTYKSSIYKFGRPRNVENEKNQIAKPAGWPSTRAIKASHSRRGPNRASLKSAVSSSTSCRRCSYSANSPTRSTTSAKSSSSAASSAIVGPTRSMTHPPSRPSVDKRPVAVPHATVSSNHPPLARDPTILTVAAGRGETAGNRLIPALDPDRLLMTNKTNLERSTSTVPPISLPGACRSRSQRRDGCGSGRRPAPVFVIQEHHASRLHWDFRLERDGVLASWALPKGFPSTPEGNHLAVHVEDHPFEYEDFEGIIPRASTAPGSSRIWDHGHLREREVARPTRSWSCSTASGPRAATCSFPRPEAKDWMIHRMDPAPPGFDAVPDADRAHAGHGGTAAEGGRRLGVRVQVGRRACHRLRRRRSRPRAVAGTTRTCRGPSPSSASWARSSARPARCSTARSSRSTRPGGPTSAGSSTGSTSRRPSAAAKRPRESPGQLRRLRRALPRRPVAARALLRRAASAP